MSDGGQRVALIRDECCVPLRSCLLTCSRSEPCISWYDIGHRIKNWQNVLHKIKLSGLLGAST